MQNKELVKSLFWIIIIILVGCVISFIGGCLVGRISAGKPVLSENSKSAGYYTAIEERNKQLVQNNTELEQSITERNRIIDSISAENRNLRIDKDRLGKENNQLRIIRDGFEKLERERQADYRELEESANRLKSGIEELESVLSSP